jgi:hypothetical protein
VNRIDLPLRHRAPLPAAPGGGQALTSLTGRFSEDLVLLCLHGPACPYCREIAADAAVRRKDWSGWGTELLVLHSEPDGFDQSFRQLHDPDGATRRRYGGEDADAVAAVIDNRGTLMDGWRLRHPEPVDWREVAETVRWTAVQEPECGACEVLPGWD